MFLGGVLLRPAVRRMPRSSCGSMPASECGADRSDRRQLLARVCLTGPVAALQLSLCFCIFLADSGAQQASGACICIALEGLFRPVLSGSFVVAPHRDVLRKANMMVMVPLTSPFRQILAWRSTIAIRRRNSTFLTVNVNRYPARLDTCLSTLIWDASNQDETISNH